MLELEDRERVIGGEGGELGGGTAWRLDFLSVHRRDLLQRERDVCSWPDGPVRGSLPPGLNVRGAKHME